MTSLSDMVEDYLAVRRSLGFKLSGYGRLLGDFVAYLDAAGATTVTAEAAMAWAVQPKHATPKWCSTRLSVARGFASHLHAFDPTAEVPPVGLIGRGQRRTEPHIYSDDELVALMGQAHTLAPRFRGATYETLIGLLVVTGMRPGEPLRLDRGDIDWAGCIVRVVGSKWGKSRDVPVQPGTLQALGRYARARDRAWPQHRSDSFFVSTAGTRLAISDVDRTFARLRQQAGITWPAGRRAPRLHDVRHTFAVKTVIRWYREGIDVEAHLPLLTTFLGHANPSHTFWYLSATPELLALAARRREHAKEGRR